MNKLVIFTLLLLFLLPFCLLAQTGVIRGKITDKNTGVPIPYVTVYVDGTMNGTITDTLGSFRLDRLAPPCRIIISHISYETMIIHYREESDSVFTIGLTPAELVVEDVQVVNENRRQENLDHFRDRFLGTDYWGEHATIVNDSVLLFTKEPWCESDRSAGKLKGDSSSTWFTVKTRGPILVDLPLLGYQLRVDLIHFSELQTDEKSLYEIHALGYFYFQPSDEASRRKTNRFNKKRSQAWYNSDRHFCKSLYENNLLRNGYYVYESGDLTPTGIRKKEEIDFTAHLVNLGDHAEIRGLKGRSFYVGYYELYNAPMDVTHEKIGRPSSSSMVHFLSDTCIIRSDGSRPDNNIMFGPEIGNKRVGAMVPYNFKP